MAVLVGIDEAGFGPILGPLVVSSSSFLLPSDLLEADLWQILSKSVGSRRKKLAGRLLVTDSKKAYSKQKGIKHLQRTVLAVLKCLDKEPANLAELITLLCPQSLERLDDYPWYQNVAGLPLSADKADLAIASSVLKSDLSSNNIKLLQIQSCCLDVAYYNKMVSAVKNKAHVLFTATSELIKKAYDNFGDDGLQIIVDRQGGRVHYRQNLQRMFPDMQLKIISESPTISSYHLQSGPRHMRLHFAVGADSRFLPVSLASMVSKYLRELLVDSINRYFASFAHDLQPTAGYWKDGLRFIGDIRTNLSHIRFEDNQLIRCR